MGATWKDLPFCHPELVEGPDTRPHNERSAGIRNVTRLMPSNFAWMLPVSGPSTSLRFAQDDGLFKRSLIPRRTTEKILHRIDRRDTLIKHRVKLHHDRLRVGGNRVVEVDSARGGQSLADPAQLWQNLLHRVALSEKRSHAEIAALLARRSQHQIADTAQA